MLRSNTRELIVCGWDEVFILDFDQWEQNRPQKIWTWKAAECTDLPDAFKTLFNTIDECKPFDQGRKILITSSGGAVALLDKPFEIDDLLDEVREAIDYQ